MSSSASNEDYENYETLLYHIWGKATLNKLRELVKHGDIDADRVRDISAHTNTRLLVTYDEHSRSGVVETFERILEEWVNQSLFRLRDSP